MPVYNSSPFAPLPTLLLPGTPGYCWGSFSDRNPSTLFYINQTSESSGSVITATGSVQQGLIPTSSNGQLVSTQGLVNVANQTNQALGTVSLDANGVGTIQFPDSTSAGSIAQAADFGFALLPPIVVVESAPGATTVVVASIPFALQSNNRDNLKSIAWGTTIVANGATVASVEFDLEGAVNNNDAEYFKLDKSTLSTGETRVYTPIAQVNFLRITAELTYTVATPKIASWLSI